MNSKKIYTLGLLAYSSLFILTACNPTTVKMQGAIPPMTQPIIQEMPSVQSSADIADITTDITTPLPEPSESQMDTPTQPNILDDMTIQYYQLVGEEEALKADIEVLERKFRINQIPAETFYAQKHDLKQQEDILEDQIDRLEDLLPKNIPGEDWIDTTNIDAIIQQKQALHTSEKELKAELLQARYDYIEGIISREDYIQKVSELEQKEDIIDDYEDFLEDLLELLGYDD